jgi:prepilin-type processing-associated H-X9-DG protein
MRKKTLSLLVSLFALLAAAAAQAQTLADRIPDDAELYIGWNGLLAPGAGFDQSHLKAVLDASDLSKWASDSIPRLFQQAALRDPRSAKQIDQVVQIVSALAMHPTAIYFGGMGAAQPGGPPLPKIAIFCDAGADSPKVGQQVHRLLDENQGSPFTLKMIDTVLVFSDFVVPEHVDKPLSQNADFQAALAQVGKDPSSTFYINGTALVATIDSLIAQFGPPQAQQMWPQVRDQLGLPGLKAVIATTGFDGKNWSAQAFVSAPSPRKGLLAMGDAPPLADELLKLIPVSTTNAGAGTCDLNALFTQIDQAIVQFAPDQGAQWHQALAQVNQTVGFDVQKDFLATLGAQWAYFDDPDALGQGPLGFSIVNKPRNPDQLQNSLNQLEAFLNTFIREQMKNQENPVTIEFRQSLVNGTSLHYLATPLISPSWAIKNGTLYIGLYPQTVAAESDRPADAKSIKDNPAYLATMQSLKAPAQLSSFEFVDVPKLLPQSYQMCLAIARTYFGFGDLFGMASPPMIVPPLSKLEAEAEPAGAIGWADDAGYHFKSIEPFPGSALFASSAGITLGGMTTETAVATSILLPSLNRARETANRVKCASNLRQIGQAILLYQNDKNGSWPPDLGTLVKTEDITAQVFCCPDTNTQPPPNMSPDEAADWVNKNSDYVFLGANLKGMQGANVVVCYENDGNHHGDGMNMLFGDGHVEFLNLEIAHKYINDSTGQK